MSEPVDRPEYYALEIKPNPRGGHPKVEWETLSARDEEDAARIAAAKAPNPGDAVVLYRALRRIKREEGPVTTLKFTKKAP